GQLLLGEGGGGAHALRVHGGGLGGDGDGLLHRGQLQSEGDVRVLAGVHDDVTGHGGEAAEADRELVGAGVEVQEAEVALGAARGGAAADGVALDGDA